ncbi:MAG: histidinol-phosphatase HisJ family protein [Clostridiales bacterium]|nr:histidinol-phosphatase HisJ family protein [Clostridiales bacterium]
MIDYHLHTSFSKDCSTGIMDVCDAAKKAQLKYIAITDHIDVYHNPELVAWDINDVHSPTGYINSIKMAQEKYPEIDITFGLETGYTESGYDMVANKVKDINPDFVIGSVHFVDGLDLYYEEYYQDKTKEQAYNRYLEHVYKSIEPLSKYAQIIGHIGYVCKAFELPYENVNMKYSEYSIVLDDILECIIENNMGIEINTSGLLSRAKTTIPDYDVILRYRKLGGEILTVGSDAHVPENVGSNVGFAFELARNAGFKYITTYKNKEPLFIHI